MRLNYDLIPEHMRAGMRLYVENGITPGSFLFFLLANESWSEVLALADDVNRRSMGSWRSFFTTIPMACWGSRENVQRWMEHGGFFGLEDERCATNLITD